MPHTVKHEITVGQIRKGDLLDEGGQLVVRSAQHKQVKSQLIIGTPDNDEREEYRSMRMTDPITVWRVEATDDERAQAMREFMVGQLRKSTMKMLANTPRVVLQTILDKHGDDYAEILDWTNLPDVLRAQSTYREALEIREGIHVLSDQRQLGIDVNTPDDVANVPDDVLLDSWAWWLRHKATRRSTTDPLSRSTSVISNIIEDVNRWAVQHIIDQDLTWSGALDELRERGARLEAEAKVRNAQQ